MMLAACSAWGASDKSQWLILAHLDGRGGLGPAVDAYEHQLRASSARHGFSVALRIVVDQGPPLNAVRGVLWRSGQLQATQPVSRSDGAAEGLADFIAWATTAQPAEHYALLVMGHGAGLLSDAAALPAGALRPSALRAGLQQACAKLGQPLDVVCLDTCYGGTLEVLYGLRGSCLYATAAPGLIFSPGLDWAGALENLAQDPGALSLVRGVISKGMSRFEPASALVGVNMGQLGSVSDKARALSELLRAHLAAEMQTLTWARAHCRSWGDHGELADVAALASGLEHNAATPVVRAAAAELRAALEQVVVAAWESNGAAEHGALGVYFPLTLTETPPEYRSAYEFASSCGWAELLDSYWVRITQLLNTNAP